MARTGADVVARVSPDVTNVWTAFGHSYINFTSGTYDQTGRMDALFRSALRIENSNWANFAQSGAMLVYGSMWNSGWLSMFYETRNRRVDKVWPYPPVGGGALICYGINDLGNLGNTTQARAAYVHATRALISRWRAATIKLNTDASIAYGAGFTASTGQEERSTTGTNRLATTTTAATITITLPSTYKGEPVVLCFMGRSDVVGGTVTFSGTAGVTGTLSTSNILPAAAAQFCPVVKRITNLTSANAGQTIIATVTQVDASGTVHFDTYWIESLTPQPVILCNIARLTTTAYANYYTSTWTGTEAAKDADVLAWNADIASMVSTEFDSMVQIADIDTALNKDPDLLSAGSDNQLHPNEFGAAKCVDAMMAAVRRLKPVAAQLAKYGTATSLNPSAPAGSSFRVPANQVNYWYSSMGKGVSATALTWVSGDMYAVPFMVTEPDARFDLVGVEVTNTPTTGNTVRIGYYLDLRWSGFPGRLVTEWTGTGLAMGASSGWKTAAITWEPDPGLYWLVFKFTSNTVTLPTMRQWDGPSPHMPTLMGSGATPTAAVTTSPMAWKITGQGTGAFPTRFPSTATPVGLGPIVALRRSAAA